MKLREVSGKDLLLVNEAIKLLREARNKLTEARAERAAEYVKRALKSSEGSRRHMERIARAELEADLVERGRE